VDKSRRAGQRQARAFWAGVTGPNEVIIMLIGAVISALLAGYLAGLLSFKVKDRWCPQCGATTSDLARRHAGHAR
jgi:hypothetical protein